MNAMINDLLEYSQVANNERIHSKVNFNEVIEQVSLILKISIDENHAVITHNLLPTITADKKLMIQLFQNLISNAIKYKGEETPKIHISSLRERDQYIVTVKDKGIGMSPEHMKHIFTIFKRLHSQEEYEGTGIGLSIAQKIVQRHHGKIWAESELGKGSTFYFTIPQINTTK
jgi:light-regulated signal transduction histidine kinase (bacteriophytochrome)